MIRSLLLTLCLYGLASCSAISSTQNLMTPQFDEARMRAVIKELASDKYEGRKPATRGETLTLAFLEDQFKQMDLEPGNGDSYFQAVPLEQHETKKAKLTIGDRSYRFYFDMVMNSYQEQPTINMADSDVVFVGYGINAPEYGWNDYANIDVKGKTVVMLINDPGYATRDPKIFKGTTMTYYGRWDYKFAEAARQGAKAAFIIHDSKPASYPWMVVQSSWTTPQLGLQGCPDPHPQIEGWLTKKAARKLLADANKDLGELMSKAKEAPFAMPLGMKANAKLTQKITHATSYNVIATKPGTSRADEHIIYVAHWDHIGKQGNTIFNGAMDNATGLSAMLELARAYAEAPPQKRSVTFLSVTGEETGLLGSRYYANNPIYPLQKTAGVFNVDGTNVYGPTADYRVVGLGQSSLESYLIGPVEEQGRFLAPESHPGAGAYFRSDHFSFAQKGVPAVFAGGGSQPIDEHSAATRAKLKALAMGCYHGECDVYRPEWNLAGTMSDLEIYFKAGRALANDVQWPGFYSQSEFHLLRPAP